MTIQIQQSFLKPRINFLENQVLFFLKEHRSTNTQAKASGTGKKKDDPFLCHPAKCSIFFSPSSSFLIFKEKKTKTTFSKSLDFFFSPIHDFLFYAKPGVNPPLLLLLSIVSSSSFFDMGLLLSSSLTLDLSCRSCRALTYS